MRQRILSTPLTANGTRFHQRRQANLFSGRAAAATSGRSRSVGLSVLLMFVGISGTEEFVSKITVASPPKAAYFPQARMEGTESKYIERPSYLSSLAHERELAFRESDGHLETEFGSEAEWLRCVKEDFPKFIPFLTRKCGLEFRGRILEIGAGAAWFSAELSKLPKVVEVIATDFSPKLLKEQAPKVFKLLEARAAKITRMPADFHKLDFRDNYFDFVVCSAVLHHAVNIVTVLHEVKRVLKPGGQVVAIREPVWPLMKVKSRSRTQTKLVDVGVNEHFYTLDEYKEFFALAGFELEAKRVNLSGGLKYYFNKVVNGLTHARYAFVATKRGKG